MPSGCMCHIIIALLCICAFCCTHETSLTFQVDLGSLEKNLNYTDLSKMDQLPTDLQEALLKTNTERLRIMAAKTYDVGDDELEAMDRTALLDVIATDIVARRGATSRRRSEKSDQVREIELQLEMKRMELESKKIEKETELEQRRIDAESRQKEAELEGKRIEAENRARELQNEREKREHELRMAEAGRPAEGDERGGYDDQNVDEDGDERGRPRMGPRRPQVETLADRVKRYGSSELIGLRAHHGGS